MKKFTYSAIVAAAAMSIAACGGASKGGYTVTGTVAGANDGDTVYLATQTTRGMEMTDTTVIKDGKFTFEGVEDSTVYYYATGVADKKPFMVDFFLEAGNITLKVEGERSSASGTPNNDAYQAIKDELIAFHEKTEAVYESIGDSTLTDEQREAKLKEAEQFEKEYGEIVRNGVTKNIGNPVGIFLFKQTYYNNSAKENEELLAKIPANYQNDPQIMDIKKLTEKRKLTDVGTKFTDFEMRSPEGKTVKLSDYAGKGKVVLVDFWASWCGPCMREMPNIIEAYTQFKDKGLEIVGVSLDQDEKAWKGAIEKMKMTWPQMSDLKSWKCEGAQLYAVNSIPHTVLIDKQGTIIARGLHGEELKSKIEEALK